MKSVRTILIVVLIVAVVIFEIGRSYKTQELSSFSPAVQASITRQIEEKKGNTHYMCGSNDDCAIDACEGAASKVYWQQRKYTLHLPCMVYANDKALCVQHTCVAVFQ